MVNRSLTTAPEPTTPSIAEGLVLGKTTRKEYAMLYNLERLKGALLTRLDYDKKESTVIAIIRDFFRLGCESGEDWVKPEEVEVIEITGRAAVDPDLYRYFILGCRFEPPLGDWFLVCYLVIFEKDSFTVKTCDFYLAHGFLGDYGIDLPYVEEENVFAAVNFNLVGRRLAFRAGKYRNTPDDARKQMLRFVEKFEKNLNRLYAPEGG
jgi:hypothetical protein